MGQQQLLLLVFLIVCVGALTVLGAYAFRDQKGLEGRHQVVQEALQVVADLQTWKRVPVALGGGNGRDGFSTITFATLGYSHTLLSNRVYKTDYGCYQLQTVGEAQHVELSFSSPSCTRGDFMARVVISGTEPGDLVWHQTPSTAFKIIP